MKLFKRIFVILIILITILIYYKFENKKIAYLETEEENSILQVIYDLPEKYREIIILRYSTGLEYAEIANILGITEETVRQRISRGKKKMERALKKQGGIRWIE